MNPRPLLPLAVVSGLFLLLYRVLDLSVAWPDLDVATPAGRARLIALTVSRIPAPLLADFLLIGTTVSLGHPGGLRLLGKAHLAGGLILLALTPVFLIDSGSLAPAVVAGEVSVFRMLVVRVLVLLLGLGIGGILTGRLLLSVTPQTASHKPVDPGPKS